MGKNWECGSVLLSLDQKNRWLRSEPISELEKTKGKTPKIKKDQIIKKT